MTAKKPTKASAGKQTRSAGGSGRSGTGGGRSNRPTARRVEQARRVSAALRKEYPRVGTALESRSPFELLVATILSAQCTDARVNEVTPKLFEKYPDAHALAVANPDEVEKIIHPTGFFRQKRKSIQGCAQAIVERHGGEVPESMEDLTALPGVGRKTAHCVRAGAMGLPGIIVDTHFKRVAGRLGLTQETDADKIERAIAAELPEEEWSCFSNAVIHHGRRICHARKPRCGECVVLDDCDYGRKNAGEGSG